MVEEFPKRTSNEAYFTNLLQQLKSLEGKTDPASLEARNKILNIPGIDPYLAKKREKLDDDFRASTRPKNEL
ncbi:MAG: hypothetical protein AAB438_00350 [Patescibacteria group bacterium]